MLNEIIEIVSVRQFALQWRQRINLEVIQITGSTIQPFECTAANQNRVFRQPNGIDINHS